MILRFISILLIAFATNVAADCCCDLQLPAVWKTLKPVINTRLHDKNIALKLNDAQVDDLLDYLETHQTTFPELQQLQKHMPNTTVELLRLLQIKQISYQTAQKTAADLLAMVKQRATSAIVSLDAKLALQFAVSKGKNLKI